MRRFGIVGSRHFPDLAQVEAYVSSLGPDARIVTGGASGVDAAATRAARACGLGVSVVAASVEETRDEAAASARNQRLVEQCDVLVAFWDGRSQGTRMTVDRALDRGLEVHVFVAGS